MKKMLIVSIVGVLLSFQAFALNSVSYSLVSQRGYCSATLLKVDNECRLVTNAHCVRNQDEVFTLRGASGFMDDYDERFIDIEKTGINDDKFNSEESLQRNTRWFHEKEFFDSFVSEVEVGVISFDRSRDLAILEVPGVIRYGNACERIENSSSEADDVSEIESARYVGFTREQDNQSIIPKVSYPRNTQMHGKNLFVSPVKARRVTSYHENGSSILVLNNSEYLPGNSGGMAVDNGGKLLGITSAIIPTQDQVYIIPRDEVVDYILNPTQNNEYPQRKINLQDVGGNQACVTGTGSGGDTGGGSGGDTGGGSGGDTGTGSGGDTGTGSGGDTGGNPCDTGTGSGGDTGTGSGGDTGTGSGGDTGASSVDCLGTLKIFEEVDEGFINDMQKVIIAIGDSQIDGLDDYKDHQGEGVEITLEEDGYPSLEVRRGIIDRLKGQYTFGETYHKSYRPNPDHVLGYDERKYGVTQSEMKVNEDTISFATDWHLVVPSQEIFLGESRFSHETALRREYQISHSDDYRTVTLSNGDEVLTCENRNYLKLICGNGNAQLSLSVENTQQDNPTIRYARRRNEHRVEYYFTQR